MQRWTYRLLAAPAPFLVRGHAPAGAAAAVLELELTAEFGDSDPGAPARSGTVTFDAAGYRIEFRAAGTGLPGGTQPSRKIRFVQETWELRDVDGKVLMLGVDRGVMVLESGSYFVVGRVDQATGPFAAHADRRMMASVWFDSGAVPQRAVGTLRLW